MTLKTQRRLQQRSGAAYLSRRMVMSLLILFARGFRICRHIRVEMDEVSHSGKKANWTGTDASRGSKHPRFPGWIPKALKRDSGRRNVSLVPAHIRVLGTYLSKEERKDIRKELGRKLGKFGRAIERVTDVNGPRKGIDQVCRIKVFLSDLPSVVVETQDAVLGRAISRALTGTEHAVRRSVRRKRMKPVKFEARARVRLL